MNEVIGGHKLLCLAQSMGVITDNDNDGSTYLGRSIETKFQYAAADLADADLQLLKFISRDAQKKGIIRSGVPFVLSRELRCDKSMACKQINNAFESLSKRFQEIEKVFGDDMRSMRENISSSSQFVSILAKDLTILHHLFKQNNEVDKYAALAFCMFSVIPIIGKSVGGAAKIDADFFIALGVGERLPAMSSAAQNTICDKYVGDICDFHTALYVFSGKWAMKDMDEKSKQPIIDAVEQSGFQNLPALQESLIKQCCDTETKNVDRALISVHSNGERISEDTVVITECQQGNLSRCWTFCSS